ncbi:MAG: phosphate ABC transporter permease PstA [Pirellulales bacterium]|nr:phosphate ABC transporter permease PstA [Pirellulales bacterium]
MKTPSSHVFILDPQRRAKLTKPAHLRHHWSVVFVIFCSVVATLSLVVLATLLYDIFAHGTGHIWRSSEGSLGQRFSAFFSRWSAFLSNPPSQSADNAGIFPSMLGTIWVCAVCGLAALPLGVATAIYLEEFKPKRKLLRHFHGFVQLNITNLAGVPSVVYGIIGMTVFVMMFQSPGDVQSPVLEFGINGIYDQYESEGLRMLRVPVESRDAEVTALQDGMTVYDAQGTPKELNLIAVGERVPDDRELRRRTLIAIPDGPPRSRYIDEAWYYVRIPFGRSVLAGGLTLMLVVLPIVIISSQEAVRAVPDSLREAALGMGCTRWQVVRKVSLPASIPGIMTGSILAMSRAIGEAAPILMIAGVVYIKSPPGNLMDSFTVMPLQIYNWASDSHREFHDLAASGIIVLLAILLVFNASAVIIRQKFQKNLG